MILWIGMVATLMLPLILWGILVSRTPRVKEERRSSHHESRRVAARITRGPDGERHYTIEDAD